jgi:multidrug efflux pump subunit AcrA (membrane-fusion protein)
MEADLALQRARLDQGVLHAPFRSEVMNRPVSLGSYVDPGDPVCELLTLELREIVLELPPSVGASVRAGSEVRLRSDALPGFDLTAPLHSVLPSSDPRARRFTGLVRLGPADDPELTLQPGMFVRATVELRAAREALTVPVDCLLETEAGFEVVKVAPGARTDQPPTAAHVPVEVLARDARSAAIRPLESTLAAGDRVVLVGKENAPHGKAIAPSAPSAPAGTAGSPRGSP